MIRIGASILEAKDLASIVREGAGFELQEQALEEVRANFAFLQRFSKDKVIYGINTGFGPMAQYRLEDADIVQTQYNLIRSHAMGVGDPLPSHHVKAMMVARLNTLMKARSGITEELVRTLSQLIEKDIIPFIPEHGGVGASGDLVQLAHLGSALIGEGRVMINGEWKDAKRVFDEEGIRPVPVQLREGLAILNGTSAMTGIGLMNVMDAHRALRWAVSFSAIINDIVASYDDHFSKGLNRVKLHEGQSTVAGWMRDLLSDSRRIRRRADHLYQDRPTEGVLAHKVQEYYSLRCVPQVLGPVLDTLSHAERVVVNELNSVNDNPVIDHKEGDVFHGGNFHGDQVAVEMDKLRAGLTKMSMVVERQLNYLLNDRLNDRFPPFLNRGRPGFNFGIQGAQYTATSTVAENQNLSYPMHLHSIPSNKDNQDIVSMGTNAAMATDRVLRNVFQVMAVTGMGVVQAASFLDDEKELASQSRIELEKLRESMPDFVEDRSRYEELEALAYRLREEDPSLGSKDE